MRPVPARNRSPRRRRPPAWKAARWTIPGLKAFLEKNLNRELNPWPAAKWDFEMLTLAAFYYHPSLDVARAVWAEARAGIVTAGARPNPTVGFTPQYVFNPDGLPPWVPDVEPGLAD